MLFLRMAPGLRPPARLNLLCSALAIAFLAWCGGPQPAWASQATQTTLSLTSGGTAVSPVAGGTVVTLTAAVQASGTALTLGQVNFCDAAAASCTDIHLVGTAQLTSAGTAVLRFRPGIGSHSYKAVFLGTLAGAPSASAAIGLTVGPRPPGLQKTFTVASISGPVPGAPFDTFALTANVGTKGAIPPSGTVSFSGTVTGTATLEPASGGTGFLSLPISQPAGGADAAPVIAIGDFNGDGIPDIVNSPRGGIAILLGNGDGTFAAPLVPNVDSGDGINAIGVGDFNGDGISDLVVADEDTATLTVLLGKGDGTFTVGLGQTLLNFGAQSIAIADFNGDGKLDVAVSGFTQATILLGNGDGTFTAAPNPPQITSLQLVAADFNGDGKIDLALASYSNTTFAYTPITILLGNGDGTFTAAPSQPQIVASQIVAADFNGDGKIDLAAADSPSGVSILLGNGDGTFTAPSAPSNIGGFLLAVGNFNGDGKADLAVAASPNIPGGNSKITLFDGNGDGTFAAGPEFDATFDASQLQFAAADLTGSGTWDLSTFGSVLLGNLAITTATVDNVPPIGSNSIQANYAGDASNAPSNSATVSFYAPPVPFSLSANPDVTVAPGASANGSLGVTSSNGFTGTLNLSCSISAPQSQVNLPTCSVPATINSSANSTANASYTVTTLATTPAGQYTMTITAKDPATGATASTSVMVSVGVISFQLSNTGATIASPGASGSSTITVSPIGGFTGQVTLSCGVTAGPPGAVNLPTCAISSPISITGSPVTTTLTVNTQPATTPGMYSVIVTAASTESFSEITSLAVTVPAAPPGFTLSSTAVTIAMAGPSATSTVTISPSGNFTGNVSLSCAVSGGPAGGVDAPTCAVTAPPAINSGTAVTATLTVSTTAASPAVSGYSVAHNQHPPRGVAIGGRVVAVASLLLFWFPIRRRRTMTQLGLLLIAILIGTAIGCGGGGTKAAAPPVNPGTTPGAYTVTVTGSSGSITSTTAVTVTVN